jgi:hypothetical protein
MSRLAFVDRVKSWFGASRARRRRTVPAAEGWPLAGAPGNLALAAAGGAGPPPPEPSLPDRAAVAVATRTPPESTAPEPKPPAAPPAPPSPEGLDRLEDLPERIAEAVSGSAATAESLAKVAAALEDRRQSEAGAAAAVAELPGLARERAALVAETNRLLHQQNRLAEAMIDGIQGLRGALGSVEESSLRHLACIEQLEAVHRQVLEVYQTTLLKAHRRLGRLSLLAVTLAAAALAAAAWSIHLAVGG